MVPIKFYLDLIPTPDSDLTLQLHGALKSGGYQKGHQIYLSWAKQQPLQQGTGCPIKQGLTFDRP